MTSTTMMPEKKVFRARVLDPTKRLQVRFRQKCRTQSPKIKRAVAVPPSGMEKDEEMESHLQQAIYAQKATSAGVIVENHVIPTPKVSTIDDDLYEKIYRKRSARNKKLIVFRDFISFFLNQSVYDADSEDEEWLNTKSNIPIDQFEQIIVKLELSSQSDIIQPSDAKALLQRYDSQIVDDVYDYWLQKRKQVASNTCKYSVLMPRLNTEVRREDKTINPYIAFRRRLDKVQTRKKQKTEIQTYEKILRLNYAMKRSIALSEMMKQREKAKLALVDLSEAIFDQQFCTEDVENRELDRILAEVATQLASTKFSVPEVPAKKKALAAAIVPPSVVENGKPALVLSIFNKPKHSQRRKIRPAKSRTNTVNYNDENIINEEWLKRNDELWSRITPTTAATLGLSATLAAANASSAFTSSSATEILARIAKYDVNSSVDGRYMFTRKFGCQYRAPTPMCLDSERFAGLITPPSTSAAYDAAAILRNQKMKAQARHLQPFSSLASINQPYTNNSRNGSIPEDGKLFRLVEGEPKFMATELPTKIGDDEEDEYCGWPLLRRRSAVLDKVLLNVVDEGGGIRDGIGDFEEVSAEKNLSNNNNNTNSSNFSSMLVGRRRGGGALGFIRRRIGRGGRVIFDLKC